MSNLYPMLKGLYDLSLPGGTCTVTTELLAKLLLLAAQADTRENAYAALREQLEADASVTRRVELDNVKLKGRVARLEEAVKIVDDKAMQAYDHQLVTNISLSTEEIHKIHLAAALREKGEKE